MSFISSDTHCDGNGKYVFTENQPGQKTHWDNIIARAKGNLISAEFGYIAHLHVFKFARVLKVKAASSFAPIRWSVLLADGHFLQECHGERFCMQGLGASSSPSMLDGHPRITNHVGDMILYYYWLAGSEVPSLLGFFSFEMVWPV